MSPPLSRRERRVLERMSDHEGRHDPAFVHRLGARERWLPDEDPVGPTAAPAADGDVAAVASGAERLVSRAGLVAVVAILLGLAAGGFPVFAAVLAVTLVMVPLALRT